MYQTSDTIMTILDNIRLPFNLKTTFMSSGPYYYLQVGDPNATCNVTGKEAKWRGRRWLLSTYMTDGEIVQTVFLAVMTAIEHEAREMFLYRGHSIFDPHYDIDKLVELRRSEGAIKERDPI